MNEDEQLAFKRLIKKVDQHEHTITQLLEIIASINRRMTDATDKR